MAQNKALAELTRQLSYTFRQPDLLERALTHRSKSAANYERLEFLGDSILGFAISSELYNRYPNRYEGELTRLRASLVTDLLPSLSGNRLVGLRQAPSSALLCENLCTVTAVPQLSGMLCMRR